MTNEDDSEIVGRVTRETDGDPVLDRDADPDAINEALAGEDTPFYQLRDEDNEFALDVRHLRKSYDLVRIRVISVPRRAVRLVDASATGVSRSPIKYVAEHGYAADAFGVDEFTYRDGSQFAHAYAEFVAYPSRLQSQIAEHYEED